MTRGIDPWKTMPVNPWKIEATIRKWIGARYCGGLTVDAAIAFFKIWQQFGSV